MLLTMIVVYALHFSGNATVFFIANCGAGITWAFVIPYLLGLTAEFDKSGQMAALGGFASKMGLASGPMVSGLLLGDSGNYALLINVSVVALMLSFVACIYPAWQQDRVARQLAAG
jgi:predicted permease